MIDQTEKFSETKRHSRLGIASVIIGGGLPILLIALLVIGFALSSAVGMKKNNPGNYFIGGFIIIGLAGPLIHLVGFGLGLGGLISKKTKKVFPITGAILNFLLGISGVLIIYFFIANMAWGFR